MPAPPSSKQKETNQKAMDAAKGKSNNYGGINTSSVRTNSKGSTTGFGPSSNSGTGFFGGINTNKVTNGPPSGNGVGGLLGGTRQAVSTPTSYAGPKGALSLNPAARMAAARALGFNPPQVQRTPGDAENMGRMMMAESGIIRNPMGGINTEAMQGVGDVIRNRMTSDQYPNTVQGVLGQPKQFSPMGDGRFANTPADFSATRVADSILSGETPSVVGDSLNFGNLNTINNQPNYSSPASQKAFNDMNPVKTFEDARNPGAFQHSFGTIGSTPPTQTASVAPMSAPPSPQRPMAQAETGPSMWEKYAPDMLQKAVTSIDENFVQPTQEQIEKYGGFERAGKLARMAVSVMNFLPGGTGGLGGQGNGGNPNGSTGFLPPQLAQNKNQTKKPPVNSVAIMPPQQNPWLYPQYSQTWAGLPTGIGGYMKG
jgi:hypothetical protein